MRTPGGRTFSTCRWPSHRLSRLRDGSEADNDPVPLGLVLDLDEAFRVLEALEDALRALEVTGSVLGLRDELATVIQVIHSRLGFGEGGFP